MHALRILLIVLWTAGTLIGGASAQVAEGGCDHADAAAHGAMADMVMQMDHAGHASAEHDDCTPGCWDGACACEGVAGPTALVVPGARADVRLAADSLPRPGTASATGAFAPTEGPPPRLL